MFNEHSILALIPARGGSKGIPRKNIKALHGSPLIAYTIAAAKRSLYIDDVVVTTDSIEIAKIARDYGASVPFMRPSEFAEDCSKTIDAVVHAVETLAGMGKSYDAVVLLQPTSPLRTSADIDCTIETFYSHGSLGVASVSEAIENPVLIRRIDSAGVLHPLLPIGSTVRRQDMPKYYHVNGAIYINRAASLTRETSLNDNPIAYVMPAQRSVDIDSVDDFMQAEGILEKLTLDPVGAGNDD